MAARLPPSSLANQLAQASQLAGAGLPAEAEKICRDILKREPKNIAALQLLGSVRTRLGAHDEAIELLTRAIAADPKNGFAHFHLAQARAARGDIADAMADRKSTRLNSSHT